MNHHEKRIILLDLVFSRICKELDLTECGREAFFQWEEKHKDAIDEVITPDVIDGYFHAKGEKKTLLSADLAKRIMARTLVEAD